jgi:hypothetical protein
MQGRRQSSGRSWGHALRPSGNLWSRTFQGVGKFLVPPLRVLPEEPLQLVIDVDGPVVVA